MGQNNFGLKYFGFEKVFGSESFFGPKIFLAAMSSSRSDDVTQSVCLCVTFFYIEAIKALDCFKSVVIVFEVFPDCLKGVGCFLSVSSLFEGCFKSVSRVFIECFKSVL